ncbi:hypothetical protein GA0061098_100345 [Bradyrhizobium shewense]|uniref:DUF4440 domain-containing protein n=2 Tax=Bradyrhizobium shewense TaxID=1761772 RepID=A0A1C3V0C4_9BRAD|nr:hypothetical protein GA0061098_100345 [Bradyrhizobium shewense]
MKTMETNVRKLFERYENISKASLRGDVAMDEVAALYASEFIAATPAGVMTGKNDEHLKQVLAKGYAHYRAIGTKAMEMRGLRIAPVDEYHCVAHVSWRATYVRKNQSDVVIDFEVHYLVQHLGAEPKVFGWVSGDEQTLLRERGVI